MTAPADHWRTLWSAGAPEGSVREAEQQAPHWLPYEHQQRLGRRQWSESGPKERRDIVYIPSSMLHPSGIARQDDWPEDKRRYTQHQKALGLTCQMCDGVGHTPKQCPNLVPSLKKERSTCSTCIGIGRGEYQSGPVHQPNCRSTIGNSGGSRETTQPRTSQRARS